MQVQESLPEVLGFFKIRDDAAMTKLTEEHMDILHIKCTGPKQQAKELSGGNQQKICLAKSFAIRPDVLFVSEPTRGIDIGAKKSGAGRALRYNRDTA